MQSLYKHLKYYKSPISKKLFISLIIQGVYTIITPLSMILLARFLGPENFGDFAFSISLVIIISIFSNLGLPTVVTRYGASYFIEKKYDYLKGILKFSNKRVTILSISIIFIFYILLLCDFIEIQSKKNVLFALPMVLFLVLSSIRTATLTAIEKVNLSQLPEMIIRPILFFLAIIVMHYFGFLNSVNAVIFYTIINLIIFIIGARLVKRYLNNLLDNKREAFESNLWIKSSIPLFLLGGIQIFGAQVDIFLLGFLTDSKDVGVFKSMYQISLLVIFSLTATNAIISPYIVRNFIEKNKNKLMKMLLIFCFINTIIAGIIAFPFFFFGDFFIELLYGKEYLVGFTCLQILIIGRLINSIFGISSQFLKMMGQEKKATKGILFGAITGIVLNFYLIPKYGIIGAAIASSVALILWNTILFILTIKSILKIN